MSQLLKDEVRFLDSDLRQHFVLLDRLLRTEGSVSVANSLPDGLDDKMIQKKLEAVELLSEPVQTGKGQFSRIREEDREAADLAYK